MIISPFFYTMALLAVLAAISLSVIFTSHRLEVNKRASRSLKFYQLYFYGGGVGWILLLLSELLEIPTLLTWELIPYYIASFLLLHMLTDRGPGRIYASVWLASNTLFAIATILAESTEAALWCFTLYILFHIPVLLGVALKNRKNAGDNIIVMAITTPLLLLPAQLYYLSAENYSSTLGFGMIGAATSYSMIALGFMTMALVSHSDSLQILADKDPLTGLYNRRGLEAQLEQLSASKLRMSDEVSAIACDIDHFKQINDRFGHDIGDNVIKACASKLTEFSRSSDIVARMGGEEFMLILPKTGQQKALVLAERLRTALEKMELETGTGTIRFTASFGIAVQREFGDGIALMSEADKALYQAKESGRNRVVG